MPANHTYETSVARANAALASYIPKWAAFARPSGSTAKAHTLIHRNMPAELSTWSSGAMSTFTEADGPTVTATAAGKGLNRYIPRADQVYDPTIVDRSIDELLEAAYRSIDGVVFGKLNTAVTDTYNDGTGTPEFVAADHTLLDGVTTQSNDVAAALSQTSLNAARTVLRGWKNRSDNKVLGLGAGPLALIVPPALEDTAISLVSSLTLPGSNAGVAGDMGNPQAMRNWTVVSDGALSSSTRWFVCETGVRSPIVVHMPLPPKINVGFSVERDSVIVSCDLEIGCAIVGPPDGLVGSSA